MRVFGACERDGCNGVDMYRIGDEIAGYRVLEILGHGGMGEVYKAAHPRLPRADAIKVLRAVHADDPVTRARFEREADLVAPLAHPNIVTVHDRGVIGDAAWIAMEYVPGTDVAGLLAAERGPLDPRLVIAIVTGIAAGLDEAHRHGVMHRDIKPANMLLTPGDHPFVPRAVKLTDFGIAQLLDDSASLTGVGTTVGTMRYSSPEQIEGRRVDARSDIYSLGAAAYELLTGVPPFDVPSISGLMSAHMFAERPRASAANRALPPAVDGVLMRAMARDPAQRYATAGEFAAALAGSFDNRQTLTGAATPTAHPLGAHPTGAHLSGRYAQGSTSGSPSGIEPARPSARRAWFRRWPAVGAVIVVIAALVGVGGGALWNRSATLGTPDRPDAKVTDRAVELAWSKVPGATTYVVRQNDTEVWAGSDTEHSLPLPVPGTYRYSVSARSDGNRGSDYSLDSTPVTVFMTWRDLQPIADLYPDLIPSTPLSSNGFDSMGCYGDGGSLVAADQTAIYCTKSDANRRTIYTVSVFAYPTQQELQANIAAFVGSTTGAAYTTSQSSQGTRYLQANFQGASLATFAFATGDRARTVVQVSVPGGTVAQAAEILAGLPI